MIIVESDVKPFEYTAKKTLRRGAMINLYEPEIHAVYEMFEGSARQPQISEFKRHAQTLSFDQTLRFVREIVKSSVSTQLRDNDDIFHVGGGDRYVVCAAMGT